MRRALLLLLLLTGCAGSGGAAAPPGVGASAPGGEQLYRKRCASCHRLRAPSEQTTRGWSEVMLRMAPRAHLSDDEREAVLAYLRSRASDAPAAR